MPRRARNPRTLRLLVVSGAIVCAAAAFQVLREREEGYVPGERTEGLVDSLGRRIPDDHPPIRLRDVTADSGVALRHFPAVRTGRLPEDMGSGVALGDFDGDGWTDLFVANAACALPDLDGAFDREAGRSRLYRNLGGGRFEDATARSGIDLSLLAMGAAFCDVDSDGDLDLFVTTYGRCRLYRNEGGGRFQDVSRASGVDAPEGFWTGIAVADPDRDGDVDLYVCGYVRYTEAEDAGRRTESQYGVDIPFLLNPSSFPPERNLYFRNRGDGTFDEAAADAGIANEEGRSLSAVMCDLTGDGWPDLYVANDVSDNAFLVNRGDGSFEDRTHESLLGDYRGAMGIAVGDFDADGDEDLFITHWVAQENALYVGVPRTVAEDAKVPVPVFMDSADRYGLGQIALDKVGWATGFVDFDGDGQLDLFAVNGSTIPVASEPQRLAPMRSQLFWNAGGRRGYFEVGSLCGPFFGEEHVGRGGAAGDLDLDGDPDLVVLLHGEGLRLLANETEPAGHSLLVRLRQPSGNTFAVGSLVEIRVGERTARTTTDTQGSYLSQHPVGEALFGLGDAAEVASIRVTWPDGTAEDTGPFPADTLVSWERGRPPRAEVLPGRIATARREPRDVESKKRFYALRERATSTRLAGDPAKAADLYREALALWPGHEDCLYYLGNCLLETGDERGALAQFERLVAFNPGSSAGWMQIGLVRLPGGERELDDLDLAEAAFGRSHELNAEETRPVVELGVVALLRDDLDRAERLFADAAFSNHRSVEARWLGGRVAYLRGDRAKAMELLREAHAIALESAPSHAVAGEGDTRHGRSQLAPARAADGPLDGWRTVGDREPDLDLEYGTRQEGSRGG